jgi:hypothetical protein
MANPSPEAVGKIRAAADWSKPDAEAAAALNAPSLPNPVPAPQRPVVLEERVLLGLLTDPDHGSAARLLNYNNLALLQSDIRADKHVAVTDWANNLALMGLITPGESAAIKAYVDSKVPDPSWSPLVSWAVANLGRPVDAEDVAASRPGPGE